MKFYGTDGKGSEGIVAPLVGAWIEISNIQWKMTANGVAPLVGAWIEIKKIRERAFLPSRSSRGSVD